MSLLEKWTWKPETPASVPCGARISAGKSGNVAMSLPRMADVLVNCVPASCMPSPESPARRMVAETSSSVRTERWPEEGAADVEAVMKELPRQKIGYGQRPGHACQAPSADWGTALGSGGKL